MALMLGTLLGESKLNAMAESEKLYYPLMPLQFTGTRVLQAICLENHQVVQIACTHIVVLAVRATLYRPVNF